MTIRSVVIAVLSDFTHIRILGPSQAMTLCAYTVVRLTLSASASVSCTNSCYIYCCTDANSLGNVSFSN